MSTEAPRVSLTFFDVVTREMLPMDIAELEHLPRIGERIECSNGVTYQVLMLTHKFTVASHQVNFHLGKPTSHLPQPGDSFDRTADSDSADDPPHESRTQQTLRELGMLDKGPDAFA